MRFILLALVITGCSSPILKDERPLTQMEIDRVINAFGESAAHARETARRIDNGEI